MNILRIWITLLAFGLMVNMCQAQSTIYAENFSGADGSTTGTGWSAFSGKCDTQTDFDFNISGGAFVIRNVEGMQCGCPSPTGGDNSNVIQFESLDISDYCNITVDFTISSAGDLECADGGSEAPIFCASQVADSGRDVIFIEANVDGARTTLYYQCGSIVVIDNRAAVLNGNNLSLALIGGTGTADESYTFDNLIVEGTQLNPITITSDISSPICAGQSITLTADGPAPWNWNTGPTTQSITVTPGFGSTTYTVSRPKGCGVERGNFNVVTLAAPIANAGEDQRICAGEPTSLIASGGTSYLWDDGSTSPTRSVGPTETTTYMVTVTSSTCSAEDEVIVTVDPLPQANISPDIEICPSTSTTLIASGGERYEWSTGEETPTISVTPNATTTYVVTVYDGNCSEAVFTTVSIKSTPEISISGRMTICEGESTEIRISGGEQYVWNDGSTSSTRTLNPSSNTDYSITVTSDGCSSIETFAITVNPLPNVNAGEDQVICEGLSTRLQASGGFTYVWDNGMTGSAITVNPTSSQTYSVTATSNGCSASDDVQVTLKPNPIATIAAINSPCVGDLFTLSAGGGDTYRWDDNSTTADRTTTISERTTYTVTVTTDGCSDDASIEIDPKPLPVLQGTSDQTICQGDTLLLFRSGADMISWSIGTVGSTIEVSPQTTTKYFIEGSTDNCVAYDTIEVSVDPTFEVSLGEDRSICAGDAIVLAPDLGTTYTWQETVDPQTDSRPLRIRPRSDTTITVLSNLGTCSARDSVFITVNDLPNPEITGSTTYCPGSTTTLSTNIPYSAYLWSNASTDATVDIASTTSVSVEVTDINGCVASSPSIAITENDKLFPTIQGSTTLCEGSTTILRAGNGFDTYTWSDGSTLDSLVVSTPGTYSLSVTSADGCSGDTSIRVDQVSNPVVNIIGDTSICQGDTALLSVGAYPQIQWEYDNQLLSSNEVSISSAATIQVQVIDENGCPGSAETSVTVYDNPELTIIGDRFYCQGGSTQLEVMGDFNQLQWTDMDTAAIKVIDAEGLYTISAINEYQCQTDSFLSINALSLPQPTIIAPDITCTGDTIEIAVAESYQSYLWNGTFTTTTLMISEGGNYNVEVVDNNGCVGSNDLLINGIDPPDVRFKEAFTVCNFPSATIADPHLLDLDTTLLTMDIAGTWQTTSENIRIQDGNIIDFSGTQSGDIELFFTTSEAQAPCQNRTFPLQVNIRECLCPEITLQSVDTLCSLGDALNLGEIQQSDFEGSWQLIAGPTADMPSINNDVFNATDQKPGDYEFEFRLVDGIAPLGCDQSKSIQIHVAPFVEADLAVIQEACPGLPAQLGLNLTGGNLFDVILEIETGERIAFNSVPGDHRFDFEVNQSTSLRFIDVRSKEGSCAFRSETDTILIEPKMIDAQLEQSTDYDGFEVSCADASDGALAVNIIQGTEPFQYNWSNGATTPTITEINAGTYTVSVVDADGCTFEDTAVITAPSPITVSALSENPICFDELGKLIIQEIQDENSNNWELIVDDFSIGFKDDYPITVNNLSDGIHKIEIINERGCSEIFRIQTDIPDSLKIDIDDNSIRLGESIALDPLFNFDVAEITWTPSDYLDCSDCLNVVATPPSSINYMIHAVDINNCTTSKQVSIDVDKERSLVVPTGFSANLDGINDGFVIHGGLDIANIENVEIYNRYGELVYLSQDLIVNIPADWDWTFKGQDLPAGEYVYQIKANFIDGVTQTIKGSFQLLR